MPGEAKNPCGSCDLCCRLLEIEDLRKPAGELCRHHAGHCGVYARRPDACRGFRCQWLKSQRLPPASRMPDASRPDRTHVLLYTEDGGLRMNVVVDPAHPSAWRAAPIHDELLRLASQAAEGLEVVLFVNDRAIVLTPDAWRDDKPPASTGALPSAAA